MVISREEASAALSAIDQTTGRSQTLRAYGAAGPIAMLWGVIWMLGYGAMALSPDYRWAWVWLPLDLVGFAVTLWLVQRGRSGAGQSAGIGTLWKGIVAAVAITTVLTAVYAMAGPLPAGLYMALPALLAGLAYIVLGLVRMTRFIWVGAALIAATVAGFFLFPAHYALWMAAVGGIGLGLGGFWIWRA
ncbi:hypothetical protein BZG35_01250 [Brevundimonas sp. LM2]|uniref:hypothetical protein n=1 Tax=Brevundimonas sp. LM2 TaxID=1938605 RepID=UPI0009839918|nr:hypothetical protein [Brevundimonas sp. LM2]AQR60434.1 hypothetical protein BZG35_01250 [Brevundimonas sp. LM2]